MRWLLAGYCGLALINITVALQITQMPRFYGVKTGRLVGFHCKTSKPHQTATVHWHKVNKYNDDPRKGEEIKEGRRIKIGTRNQTVGYFLYISDLRIEDRGVYFCKLNDSWGTGTELQVVRPVSRVQSLYRTNMKDGLILLQGLLLAVCIAAVLLRKRNLLEKNDSIYEEPETDHIYEGLTIETCGGGLYEELSVYTQPEGAEAPWE